MRPFRIDYPESIVNEFVSVALPAFPHERYGVLLGTWRGQNWVRIKDLWLPEKQERYSSPNDIDNIRTRSRWRSEAEAIADSTGLSMVGDVHSHCYDLPDEMEHRKDTSPSLDDWIGFAGEPWVQLIVVLSRREEQVQISHGFWPPIQILELRKT